METTKLILLTFLLITLASCMPDSLTKFEEDEATRDISGGSSEVVDTDNSDGTLTGISISQQQGDILILRVDNIDNFNVGDNINVSTLAANLLGLNNFASVIAITRQDDGNLFLTVTLGLATAIPATYVEANNFIDNCSSGYSSCGSTSVGAAQVDFVGFYLPPAASFSKTLNSIVSSTAMDLTYTVDPAFPNSIQLDLNTVGDNSDDAIESPVGPFRIDSSAGSGDFYTITASVTNFGDALDETETAQTSFFITGRIPGDNVDEDSSTNLNGTMIPTAASMARYQYLRLEGNSQLFYRGSRISVNTTDNTSVIVGKVLLTDDSNGILVEATGDIEPGYGIDNTAKFYSNETVVKKYEYWYVDSVTDFDIGDTITSSGGDTAVIEDKTVDTNRLYVLVQNGDFEIGQIITEDDVSRTTTLRSVEARAFVNGVLEVGNSASFTVGGSVTTAAGDKALVVAKDDTDDLLYIMHLTGTFSENEAIDNEDTFSGSVTTITAIVGPIVSLSTVGGSSTSSGVDFREGSLVSSSSGATQRAAGYAVAGTNIGANTLVVQVEHFDNNKWFDITNNLDDYTMTNIGLGSPYTIAGSDLSQLMIGYVDESIHIEPFVLGSFSNSSLAPDSLPAGLTFDSTTGTISGTPTEPTSELDYTISFSYPGEPSVSYSFSLIVYNQFEITQVTDDGSSYLMHKEGRGLAGAKCKVLGSQVIDDPTDPLYGDSLYGFNDIVCRMEAGEQDLYAEGIKLKIKAGGGMCEFVRYKPFSYQAVPSGTTSATYVKYSDFDGSLCVGAVTASGEAIDPTIFNTALTGDDPLVGRSFGQAYCQSGDCIADDNAPARFENGDGYCANDHSVFTTGSRSYPNTDNGSYDLVTVNCELTDEDTGDCACSGTRIKVDCNGNKSNGIAGPIRDTGINVGIENSIIYSSFNSMEEELILNAPINSGASGNFRLANYTAKNGCYSASPSNDYHIEDSVAVGLSAFSNTWEGYSNVNDPFGASGMLNQFYGFECLNAAGDVKARVRLQVREWDRTFVPETAGIEELIPGTPMDDSTTSCFGSNCNNRRDFDDIIGTDLTCNAGTVTPPALTLIANSVVLTAGSHSITGPGGTFNATDFQKGTIMYLDDDANLNNSGYLTFVIDEYVSDTQVIVTRPSPQDATGIRVNFYDGYRFPLEGF